MSPFLSFLFTVTGSFAIWLFKGFKGSFDSQMVRIEEKHSARGTGRYFLGIGIWIGILSIAGILLTRPSKQRAYNVKTNEKGEIIEMKEVK